MRVPIGLLYENATVYLQLTEPLVFKENVVPFDQSTCNSIEVKAASLQGYLFKRFQYVSVLMPDFTQISSRYTYKKVILDQASFSIEMELHRLKHGIYPTRVNAPKIPVDPYTGEEMHYQSDGDSYLLYSVGSNRIDEGGLLKHDRDLGDWVWKLNLPEDFDREEYLRPD